MTPSFRPFHIVLPLVIASVLGCDKKSEGPADAKAGPAEAGVAAPQGAARGGAAVETKGASAKVRAGDNLVERAPDGTVRARNAEGAEATVHADGAVDAKAADGTEARVEANEDGSSSVRSTKGKVETDAAGRTKIVGPNGEKVEVGEDGSVKVGGVKIGQ